jgi:hypothetical protein
LSLVDHHVEKRVDYAVPVKGLASLHRKSTGIGIAAIQRQWRTRMQAIGSLGLISFNDSPCVKPVSQVIEVRVCCRRDHSQPAYVAAFLYYRNQMTETGQKDRPRFFRRVSVAPPTWTIEHRVFDHIACT